MSEKRKAERFKRSFDVWVNGSLCEGYDISGEGLSFVMHYKDVQFFGGQAISDIKVVAEDLDIKYVIPEIRVSNLRQHPTEKEGFIIGASIRSIGGEIKKSHMDLVMNVSHPEETFVKADQSVNYELTAFAKELLAELKIDSESDEISDEAFRRKAQSSLSELNLLLGKIQ